MNIFKRNAGFLGRQYYRLVQGAGSGGMVVNAIFTVANTYGIYINFMRGWNIPILLFVPVGAATFLGVYWSTGFVLERIGFYREMQSHMNREINPEWTDAYDKIKKIAELLDVS